MSPLITDTNTCEIQLVQTKIMPILNNFKFWNFWNFVEGTLILQIHG